MKTKTTKLFYCVLIAISIAVGKANAQMVFIPDTNFRNWIATNYPGAIVGDSLDTTNAGVVNEDSVDCSNQNISDLTGVQYFVNAQSFQANYNFLITFPTIPPQAAQVDLSYNNISFITSIPFYIRTLNISANGLSSLPALPNLLRGLNCRNNNLDSLPALPDSLEYLNIAYNNLTSLPTLPSQLLMLLCDVNLITILPALPDSLQQLSCNYNNLSALPALPTALKHLACGANSITSIPQLPVGLTVLTCSWNSLTSLPELPDSLKTLECYANTNLSCLPKLHDMDKLYFIGTAIKCIPNYVNIINYCMPALNTLPVCNIFNANGCDFYSNIYGLTYLDSNANCVYNGTDTVIKNIPIQLLSNGNLMQQASTAFDGSYAFVTDSNGVYDISVDTNDLPFDVICPVNNLYTDTITSIDSLMAARNFSLECKGGLHIGIKSIYTNGFSPARISTVNINVEDLALFYGMHCASGESGVVTTTLNGPVTYISPAPGALTPTTVTGNILTYTVPDFGALNSGAFNIIVQTDTFATIGTQVCVTVTTLTTNASGNIKNDSLTQCFTIVGSFDPNDKQVSPVSAIDINSDGWLIYTINFQNTGTAQAYNIHLVDTLDNNINWSTFKLTAYSHEPQVQLFNTGILKFNFPNINLPDSNANEPLSHGYVQYKVKLKPGLSLGTPIYNTAYIYFDFNPAVVTNTTQNVLVQPTAIGELKNETDFNAFPNPVKEVLYVSLKKSSTSNTLMTITDMQGRMVGEKNTNHTNDSVIPIDVSTLSQGVYLLRVNGVVKMFVKM